MTVHRKEEDSINLRCSREAHGKNGVDEKMDGAEFREIYGSEAAKDWRMGQRFVFQRDNVQKHPAEWVRAKHVHVSERSSQSPDLNPTENLWQDLKRAAPRHSEPLSLGCWAKDEQNVRKKSVSEEPSTKYTLCYLDFSLYRN